MVKIIDEVLSKLPSNAAISEATFEAANIVIYTKSKDFFLNNNSYIRDIVNDIKKRIELRPDPSITLDQEKAKEIIEKIIPPEAGIANILFDAPRSEVTIEAEKPGLAIGKAGDLLKQIRQETYWVPLIRRTPAIKSKIIENIRHVLYENNDFRKKFLERVGHRIYDGWLRGKKNEWVRVSFLGAAREVGRSCILVQTPESRIMMDCGINVASEENAYPLLESPDFDIKELDAVIISHAHLDHSGFLPYLFKYGYDGPVYCTEPTRDIMALLQLDYIGIAAKDAKKAIYSSTDIKEMVKHTIPIGFEEVTDITPDIRLTFYNAGHTIGSCQTHLHIGNGLHNLVYTADMLYETSNLLSAATTKFPRLETLIIEATYGGKNDIYPPRREAELFLMEIIKNTIKRGGKVLLPVLGVGRAQEIQIILDTAVKSGEMDKVPVYIQGMVWDVTAIHTAYPDFFNAKVKKNIFHKDQNPFLSEIFKRVAGQKEMMEVIDYEGPCIIMATSGMLTGGPSVEYLKHLANDSRNSLVLNSYQGEGSLGRRLQNGDRQLYFQSGEKQEMIEVKMEIFSIHSFTGHSNRQQLQNFIYKLQPKPKRIITQHGESSRCLELASDMHKMAKIETSAPRNLEALRIR